MKKCKSITEKKKRKHDKILSLEKSVLNSVEVIISKVKLIQRLVKMSWF